MTYPVNDVDEAVPKTNHQKQEALAQQDFLRLIAGQINTLGQTEASVQNTLHKLVSSLQSNQALQASALVGRKILVNSNILHLAMKGDVIMAIDVPVGLNHLQATISSYNEEIIVAFALEPNDTGYFQFSWDGLDNNRQRVSPGIYKIQVQGWQEGQAVFLDTMILANVDSVSLGHGGSSLHLHMVGLGSVLLDEVVQISL